jgi:ATP-dependent DNA ligase
VTLPLKPPYPPMEALLVNDIPNGQGWQYEPKWDGFRCLAFRDADHVELQSKAGQPLARYFPDVVGAIKQIRAKRFVLDGEIVVPVKSGLSFDDLLLRIHPAESRVRKLAQQTPALFIAFDLLADQRGKALVTLPLEERRERLTAFAKRFFPKGTADGRVRLSPATTQFRTAQKWFRSTGSGLDGVVAKKLNQRYLSGERAMLKIKPIRTADCVVGGFRYASRGKVIGSLLLGLHDDEGLLHHVGFTSSFSAKERKSLTPKFEALARPPGFTGRAPGGPSRWSTKRSMEWQPVVAKVVVEVQFDHFTGGRFRHGTKFMRWRPDKAPEQCTFDQLTARPRDLMKLLT